MNAETQQPEYPYFVKIETSNGQSANVPIAFLTRQQVENFLQFDFKRRPLTTRKYWAKSRRACEPFP